MDLDIINGLSNNTLLSHLGIDIISVTRDEVMAQMPVDERTIQPFKLLHGGASLALAESVASIGSLNLCASDEICYGLQVSANHISSAPEGDCVQALASILHRGSTTHIWNVDITSLSTGRLVSSIRVTNCIRKKNK